jgi:K+-sensing histidine kinase KdpD
VLANLVSNALKFSPPDSPVHLRVVDPDNGEVHFEVQDQGPGVDPEERERIFEKFSRARGAQRRGEGTGLGLYIARSLAHGQGGRIQVDSEVGEGSTFTFVLPKAGGDVQPAGSEHREPREAPPTPVQPAEEGRASGAHDSPRDRRHRSVARSVRNRWRP